MDQNKDLKTAKKWTHSENLKFLSVWQEMNDKMKTCANKTEVYLNFKSKLNNEDLDVSIDQIKKKISNFKEGYKRAKPGVTGSSPSSWPYYMKVKEILGTSHYYNQELATTVESEVTLEDSSGSSSDNIPRINTQIRARKRKAEEKEDIKETIKDFKRYGEEVIEKFDQSTSRLEQSLTKIEQNIQQLVNLVVEKNS